MPAYTVIGTKMCGDTDLDTKEVNEMTNREMDAIVIEMKNWESEIEKITMIIDSIKTQLKNECVSRGEDEIHTDTFVIRYKDVVTPRFDTSAFKKENFDLYSRYIKENVSKRFSVK